MKTQFIRNHTKITAFSHRTWMPPSSAGIPDYGLLGSCSSSSPSQAKWDNAVVKELQDTADASSLQIWRKHLQFKRPDVFMTPKNTVCWLKKCYSGRAVWVQMEQPPKAQILAIKVMGDVWLQHGLYVNLAHQGSTTREVPQPSLQE